MKTKQRQVIFDIATQLHQSDNIGVDADVDNPHHFDAVEDGVWVRAWVKVPANRIPDYNAPVPAPASVVFVAMTFDQFKPAYIQAYLDGGEGRPSDEVILSSWQAYQRNPTGHFLSKKSP